jgi:hypothetical protein
MQTVLYPPSRPQSVGEVLDSAFRIFGATLLRCLPYAVVAVIAGQLPSMYEVLTGHALAVPRLRVAASHDPLWWILYVVAVIASLTLTNAVLLRQYALATGRPAATAVELEAGVRRVPGMLLIGAVILVSMVVCFLPLIVMRGFGAAQRGPISGSDVLLFLVLSIPASYLLMRWSASGPAYLLTDRGPVQSLAHSWELTSGSFWRLSLIYGIGVVMLLVLYGLASVVVGFVSLVLARADVAVMTAAATVAVALLGSVGGPFYSALALAVYGDLSARREGADLAQRLSAPAAR